jgi:hypothetical protein
VWSWVWCSGLSRVIFDRAAPYAASLVTLLATLQLLEFFSPEYLTTSHRFWQSTAFKVDVPIFLPLLILTLVLAMGIAAKEPRYLIPPLISGLSILILDLGTTLAVVSLISVIVFLYQRRRFQEYCIGLLGVVSVIEASSLLHYLVFVPLGLRDPFQALTSLEQSLFYLAAQLSPYFMLIYTYVGIGVPLYHLIHRPTVKEATSRDRSGANTQVYLALVLTLLLSVAVAVYPYLSKVNPENLNPGVDIDYYLTDYNVIASDPSQIFTAMGGSRPIYYLLLFAFQKITSLDPLSAIRLFPIILNPLLCASAFILTREITRDTSMATFASFFTASGFTLAVGMYAYFLTSILMLSIIFLSLAALLKALREKSRIYLALAITLGCLFVFTHPWTFVQYMAAVCGATILTLFYSRHDEMSHNTRWLILYCVLVASTDVVKLILLRDSIEGVAAFGRLLSGITTPTTFWLDFINTSRFYLGGYLTNFPLLTLAAIGLVKTRERTIPNLILWVLSGSTSFVYLIGDTVIKSRLLYNIPVGVLAAYGISYIDDLKVDRGLKMVLKLVIVVSLLSYLFRDLANLI